MRSIEEIKADIESLDPESEDFDERVGELEVELVRAERRARYERLKNSVLPSPEKAEETDEPDMVTALWSDGKLAEFARTGGSVQWSAQYSTKTLLTNPGDIRRQIPDVMFPEPAARRLRDVMGPVTLGPNERAVSFVRETGYTISADVVPEGGTKPESAITLEAVTKSVDTIAHSIPVTRQALASRQTMQRYIERRLVQGLLSKVDAKLINDYVNDPAIPEVTQASGENKVDTLVRAGTQILEATEEGVVITAAVMNYQDYLSVVSLKDANGNYLFPQLVQNAFGAANLPVNGLVLVRTSQIPAGKALIGAFGGASALYETSSGTIRATDSHADEFVKNIVRILAEIEIVHAIELPAGFREVTFA